MARQQGCKRPECNAGGWSLTTGYCSYECEYMHDADQLRAENQRLRDALRHIADATNDQTSCMDARKALEECDES